MKRCIVYIIIVITWNTACNNLDQKETGFVARTNIYDSVEKKNLKFLDHFGLSRYSDSAKWLLYTFHCDDTAVNREGKLLPISSLDIKLSLAEKVNDTLSLLYSFMENDSTLINEKLKTGLYITDGIEFKISDNKVIAYISGEATLTNFKPGSRLENSLQPEVVAYIKTNRDKLNVWFRNEAIRRRIVE